jgi:hypothetical protein
MDAAPGPVGVAGKRGRRKRAGAICTSGIAFSSFIRLQIALSLRFMRLQAWGDAPVAVRWRGVMRTAFVTATVIALSIPALAIPAYAQVGGVKSSEGAGKVQQQSNEPPPAVVAAKKKEDEKAFNDAVKRIPLPDKKYDPWGGVRGAGK